MEGVEGVRGVGCLEDCVLTTVDKGGEACEACDDERGAVSYMSCSPRSAHQAERRAVLHVRESQLAEHPLELNGQKLAIVERFGRVVGSV